MGKNNRRRRRSEPVDPRETGFSYAPFPVDALEEPTLSTAEIQARERDERARARAEAKATTQNKRTPSEEARFVKKLRDTVEENTSWVATRAAQHKASDSASKRAKIETDLRDTQGRYENGSRDWIENDERVERHQLEQDAATWKDFITQKETRKKVEAENKKAARVFVAKVLNNRLAKEHDQARRKTGFSAFFDNRQTKIIARQQKTAEQNAIATQSNAHRHAIADGEQRERSSLLNVVKPAPKPSSRLGATAPGPEQVFKRRTEIAATLSDSGKKAPKPKPTQSAPQAKETDSGFFVVPKERPETAAKKEEKPAEQGWMSYLTGGWL